MTLPAIFTSTLFIAVSDEPLFTLTTNKSTAKNRGSSASKSKAKTKNKNKNLKPPPSVNSGKTMKSKQPKSKKKEKAPSSSSNAKAKHKNKNLKSSPSAKSHKERPLAKLNPVQNGIILHVAEKPSIASSIANALSQGSFTTEKRGMCPTHTFSTSNLPYPGQDRKGKVVKMRHRVTSVVGHVFSLDFGKEYQSWDSVDPAELFNAPVVKKPTKKGVVRHLQSEGKGLILKMDGSTVRERILILRC